MLDTTESIPWTTVNGVLVAERHEQRAKQCAPSLTSIIRGLPDDSVFRSETRLLLAEKDALSALIQLERNDLGANWWADCIREFASLGDSLGCRVTDRWFTSIEMAQGIHGISHVTRVMFWVHALSRLQAVDGATREAALYAAFIHDACRQSNAEDEIHGRDAVRRYQDFLREKVDGARAQTSIDAVAYHCLPDDD